MSEAGEVTQRRLSAILSMDAVGYSRMMAADEASTVRTLTAYRDEIALLVGQHGGRVVDNPGDNLLCEFPLATSAVACALEIQRVLGARNSTLDDQHKMVFRIGVHLGEVLAQGPRIYGDGVNIASRLEGLAEPGGVCVSQTVRDQIGTKLTIAFHDLGPQAVKNIAQPVRVYRARSDETGGVAAAKPRSKLWISAAAVFLLLVAGGLWLRGRSESPGVSGFDEHPAIAVLPFDNLSSDPEQAFFADGLAEDLITRLSTWRAFPVIARNSSFQYRGGNADLKRVGKELGARYVVEGSVRRAGDRIRVTAQLIDASSGEHVWAETFDREVSDVFVLQDEISATIAASLVGDLNRAEGERARLRGTGNLEAWSLYQLGLQHVWQLTREDNAEARRMFEQSVALDPRFATALANLATTEALDAMLGWSDEPEKDMAAALATARRAVELDPRDPAALGALGAAHLLASDVKNGLESTRRAVDLNPSMPQAWIWLGWAEMLNGAPEASIAALEHVPRLDPKGTLVALADDNLSYAYWATGRYEDSLDAARRLIHSRPGYYWGYLTVALDEVALGRMDEARAAIAEARRIEPNLSIEMLARSFGVKRSKLDERRDAILRQAGLE